METKDGMGRIHNEEYGGDQQWTDDDEDGEMESYDRGS